MDIDTTNLTLGIIGACTGVIGAVAGGVALWHQVDQSRVLLKVIPKVIRPGGGSCVMLDSENGAVGDQLCIEVINLSGFPIILADVGYIVRRGPLNHARMSILRAPMLDGGTLPQRLEPRTAVTCYAAPHNIPVAALAAVVKAYAHTQCDVLVCGDSKSLRNLVTDSNRLVAQMSG